jgi:extracellular elastinolytic metalloproteinase
VQNLFYLNNVVHDILYLHGFTESVGNFQVDNFGKGGAGNDAVKAEAQDGGGLDNANFATPPDGRKPRMQMYLWSGPVPRYEVAITSPVNV